MSATVRLKVSYKTPQALLTEFTRSVGKGGVAIESRRPLAVGTRFVFELRAAGVEDPVEVHGEVLSSTPGDRGKYLLNIRYQQPDNRLGLDSVIKRIFDAHRYEKVRKYPRIPLQLRATEDTPYSPSYLVRDISRGGVGIEIEAPELPKSIRLGVPSLLEVTLSIGQLILHGEIVWLVSPTGKQKLINPCLGIAFGKLRQDTVDRLEEIISLNGFPPPPWKARISFGLEAVTRMPGVG